MEEFSKLIIEFEQFLKVISIKYTEEPLPKNSSTDTIARRLQRLQKNQQPFFDEASIKGVELIKTTSKNIDIEKLKTEFNQLAKSAYADMILIQ